MLTVLCAVHGRAAHAQLIDTYLPAGIPGFDQDRGVTVLSRLRPLYEEPGVRLGSLLLHGEAGEDFGYNSNITGTANAPRSAFLRTSSSVSGLADWSRDKLGFTGALDNYTFVSAPQRNYTDYRIGIGEGHTVLRNPVNFAYSHISEHELGTTVGAVPSDVPVRFDVDLLRSDYKFDSGRFGFTPAIDFRAYRFGPAVFGGQNVSQAYRDRTVLAGGLTTQYALSDQRSLVLVVQGIGTHYLRPRAGAASSNAKTVLVLTGLDYQASGLWRYRLLVGVEARAFESAAYRNRVAPVTESSVTYSPTGLTTITASVRQEIEDPQTEATSGYTYTAFGLVLDHEYRRNILLQGRTQYQMADYFQRGGTSTSYSAGTGVTWLVNRRLRLVGDYDVIRQDSKPGAASTIPALPATAATLPSYTQHVLFVGAKWRL